MKDFYRLFNAISALLLYYDNLKDFRVAYRYIREDLEDTYRVQLINESEYLRLRQQMFVIYTGVTTIRDSGTGSAKLNGIFTAEKWEEVEQDV